MESSTRTGVIPHLAKHFRDVHFGGNWTSVDLKNTLFDVSWKEATTVVHGCNSIAALTFHMHYYVAAVLKVLQGGPLDAKDAYSFALPPMESEADWDALRDKVWKDATLFATAIEELSEEKLDTVFIDPKYGTYYRNLQGITEHVHYHLGQVVLLKKIIRSGSVTL